MSTIRLRSFFISLPLLLVSVISCAEPINLTFFKQELIKYHDSGSYAQEINASINQAKDYISKRVAQNNHMVPSKKLAIILDIDETSLSNYADLKAFNFGVNKQYFHSFILKAKTPPVLPTLQLYQFAKQNGVAVFFVTGRIPSEKVATVSNLKRAGYKQWEGLFLKPSSYSNESVIPFKSSVRKEIAEKQGYTIIATIGDQWSDLKGGYAEKGFKLPNPYYYLP